MINVNWSSLIYYSSTILDILVVAYIIYIVINFFVPNNILPLSIFLAICIIIVSVAQVLKMQLTLWIVQKLFLVLPFAILILFQQEIKQFLTHKFSHAVKNLFSTSPELPAKKQVDEIVKCFRHLSRHRIGAIIVIEQNSRLDIIKSKAVSLQAKISSPLLISIFNPMCPLHDGAVVIYKNKIDVASAFLPLTERDTSLRFGSRHRAALGVTETTDAIALVVSEETGHISYTLAGEMFENIGLVKLEEILSQPMELEN